MLSLLLDWREAYLPEVWRRRLLSKIGDDLRPSADIESLLRDPSLSSCWASEGKARDLVRSWSGPRGEVVAWQEGGGARLPSQRPEPLLTAALNDGERAALINSFDPQARREYGEEQLRRFREGILSKAAARAARIEREDRFDPSSMPPIVPASDPASTAAFAAAMPSVHDDSRDNLPEAAAFVAAMPAAPASTPHTRTNRDSAIWWFSQMKPGPRKVLYGDLEDAFNRRPKDEGVLRRIDEAWGAMKRRQRERR